MNKQLKEKQRFFFFSLKDLKTCDYFEIIWKILTTFFLPRSLIEQ